MLKSKEKEYKEITNNLDALKIKYGDKKKNSIKNKQRLNKVRANNFTLKKLICSLIHFKSTP